MLTSGSALGLHVNEVAETLRFRTCVSSLTLEMAEEYRIRIEHRDYLAHDLSSVIPICEDDDAYLALRQEKA